MHASMRTRGASVATAGSAIRPLACAAAPAARNPLAALGRMLLQSTWLRPALKFVLLAAALTALSWIGSRQSLLGWRLPSAPEPSSTAWIASMTSSMRGAAAAPDAAAPDAGGTQAAPTSSGKAAPGVLPDGRVVLNAASVDELCKLPKVGPKRAAAIVALRARMGRFRSVRDLLRVKGLGVRTLQKIAPMVVLDPPPEAGDAGR